MNFFSSLWNGLSDFVGNIFTSGTGYNPLTASASSYSGGGVPAAATAGGLNPDKGISYTPQGQGYQSNTINAFTIPSGLTKDQENKFIADRNANPAAYNPQVITSTNYGNNTRTAPGSVAEYQQTQPNGIQPTSIGAVRPSTYNPAPQQTPQVQYGPTQPASMGPSLNAQGQRLSTPDQGNPYIDQFTGQWVVPKVAFSGLGGAGGGGYIASNNSNLATQGAQGGSMYTGTLGGTSGLSTPALSGSYSSDEEQKNKQQPQNPFSAIGSYISPTLSSVNPMLGGGMAASPVLSGLQGLFGSTPQTPINVQPGGPGSFMLNQPVPSTMNATDLVSSQKPNSITTTPQYASPNDRASTNLNLNQTYQEKYNAINQQQPTPANPVEDTTAQAKAIENAPDGYALKNAMDSYKAQNTQLGELTSQRIDIMKKVQAINETYSGAINEIKNNPNLPKGLAVRRLEAINKSSKDVLQGFVNQLQILNQSIDDQNKLVDRTFQIAQFAEQSQDRQRQFAMSTLQLMVTSHAIGGFSDKDLSTFSQSLGIPVASLQAMKSAANQPDIKIEGTAKDGFYSTSIDKKTNKVTITKLTDPVSENTQNANNPAYSQVTGKPLSDAERTAQGFATRAGSADSVINTLGSKFTGVSSYFGQYLPNAAKSEDRQKFEQAQRDFVNAVLRRESGAAISPSEFESASKQYFPQPGDTDGVLLQKSQNRNNVINSLKLAGGLMTQSSQPKGGSASDPLGLF